MEVGVRRAHAAVYHTDGHARRLAAGGGRARGHIPGCGSADALQAPLLVKVRVVGRGVCQLQVLVGHGVGNV